jgi:hypothetical protein
MQKIHKTLQTLNTIKNEFGKELEKLKNEMIEIYKTPLFAGEKEESIKENILSIIGENKDRNWEWIEAKIFQLYQASKRYEREITRLKGIIETNKTIKIKIVKELIGEGAYNFLANNSYIEKDRKNGTSE